MVGQGSPNIVGVLTGGAGHKPDESADGQYVLSNRRTGFAA